LRPSVSWPSGLGVFFFQTIVLSSPLPPQSPSLFVPLVQVFPSSKTLDPKGPTFPLRFRCKGRFVTGGCQAGRGGASFFFFFHCHVSRSPHRPTSCLTKLFPWQSLSPVPTFTPLKEVYIRYMFLWPLIPIFPFFIPVSYFQVTYPSSFLDLVGVETSPVWKYFPSLFFFSSFSVLPLRLSFLIPYLPSFSFLSFVIFTLLISRWIWLFFTTINTLVTPVRSNSTNLAIPDPLFKKFHPLLRSSIDFPRFLSKNLRPLQYSSWNDSMNYVHPPT